MKSRGKKPEFQCLSQLYTDISETTANIDYILTIVQRRFYIFLHFSRRKYILTTGQCIFPATKMKKKLVLEIMNNWHALLIEVVTS